MKALLIAVVAASLLSACSPRQPIAGSSKCSVWNDVKSGVTGRTIEVEYAAGFIDGYGVTNKLRSVQYGWVVDAISTECERDPDLTVQDAAERAMKRFEN